MDEMLYSIKGTDPVCIEIISMNDSNKAKCNCIISGNIEIGEDEIIVVPYWALSKLGIDPFSLVSIENVNNVRKAGFIKVRADVSDYVYWDNLKETLESEFSKIHYVSVSDPIHIFGIEFYIVELRDQQGIRMLDGSLFNTDLEIDFDTPLDIVEQERREKEELLRLEEEKLRQLEEMEKNKKRMEEEEYLRKNPHFQGKGYSISGQSNTQPHREITREERAKMFERLFEQQKKNSQNN
jgi:NADPH-dependent glutamate synthase beta subunit-like oxidoreductase